MLEKWDKFSGWKVLEYFIRNPNTKIHIQGLARELKISSKTAKEYCDIYARNGIFNKERVANSIRFYLNNEDKIVKELKKFWFLSFLREQKVIENLLKLNRGVISILLYGAYSSGEYTNESDIDILIVAQTEKLDISPLSEFGVSLGKEVGVTKFTLGKWRELKKKKDNFIESVLKNNIVVYGGEI